jgi:hypothetical protein
MGFQVKGTDGVKVVKSKQKQARKNDELVGQEFCKL